MDKTILIKILKWLSGKKGAAASLVGLTVAYLATKSILGEAEVILIMGTATVLFGGASFMTRKMVYPIVGR